MNVGNRISRAPFLRGLFLLLFPVFLCGGSCPGSSEGTEKKRPEDKIEFVKAPDGRELIKITGQPASQIAAVSKTGAQTMVSSASAPDPSGRYGWLSLPQVRPEISRDDREGVLWYTITTDRFFIEIEENEAFGTKTAAMLEGFQLLLGDVLKLQKQKPGRKLELLIFKGRSSYDAFCKAKRIDSSQTRGITYLAYASRSYGALRENKIIFYWDRDWRKLSDERLSAYARQNFYATLFHEATHQLLHVAIPKSFPRWLDEGLAGYFSNTLFDGKEIFLPLNIVNPFASDMESYLERGRKAMEVFAWSEKTGSDEPAFYGLSASFITFLIRDPRYRSCLDDLLLAVKQGVPAHKMFDAILKSRGKDFWKAWILSYEKALSAVA